MITARGKQWLLFCCIVFINFQLIAQAWTISQCIDTAIQNNLNIRQSLNTIELNRLNVKQSKNNLLPTVNGSLSESLGIGRMVNPVTDLYQTGTVWSTGAGLAFTQNLFNGLQYLNAIKQNELTWQSSKYDLDDSKFNLTISVVNDFLQVLYTHETIKIAQNQISADSEQLQTTSDLEYVGKKTESDLLQIKSQLSTDKYALVSATSQWKLAKVNLQQLMDLEVNELFEIDYTASVEPSAKALEDVNSVFSQSLAYQPIIKSYSLKTQSASYAVSVARGAYYPQLMLKGNIGTNYSSAEKETKTITGNNLENIGYVQGNPAEIVVGNVSQQFTTVNNYPFANQLADNLNGTLSLGLSIPMLNYLQVRNNVKKQQVNFANATLNEDLTKVNLRKTIEQVYINYENAQSQYKSANEEVEATKAAYDISVIKYQQGKKIASDLILQKNSYLKALSDYLQARYGLLFNSKILDYYRGLPITF